MSHTQTNKYMYMYVNTTEMFLFLIVVGFSLISKFIISLFVCFWFFSWCEVGSAEERLVSHTDREDHVLTDSAIADI